MPFSNQTDIFVGLNMHSIWNLSFGWDLKGIIYLVLYLILDQTFRLDSRRKFCNITIVMDGEEGSWEVSIHYSAPKLTLAWQCCLWRFWSCPETWPIFLQAPDQLMMERSTRFSLGHNCFHWLQILIILKLLHYDHHDSCSWHLIYHPACQHILKNVWRNTK